MMKILSFSQRQPKATGEMHSRRQQPMRSVAVAEPLTWWERLLKQLILATGCFIILVVAMHLPLVGEQASSWLYAELNREPDWIELQRDFWQAWSEISLPALPVISSGDSGLRLEMPVRGVVSSPFGSHVNPETNKVEEHRGIDFDVRLGTAVAAALPGTVVSVGEEQDYGLLVRLEHENGYTTYYAHLLRAAVRAGDVVTAGQAIGWSGNSGLSTGAHLHFELRLNDTPLDPAPYLR